MRRALQLVIVAMLALWPTLAASIPAAWTKPFPPFQIADNLYYVGSEDLAAYLVVTWQGHILINANLASSPPQIKASVEHLGFDWRDIRLLLISHAHYDHAAGCTAIRQTTGALLEVMDADVASIQSGGRTDFQYRHDQSMWFPPAHVDQVLHDGDKVRLGGMVLTAHKTAGHTPGTTTWTMVVPQHGKRYHVVIVGSPNVLDSYRLVHNNGYPGIARDFEHQFRVLESLPCDIFLGAHGSYFGLQRKYEKWNAGDREAFIDPAGYRTYIKARQRDFEARLHHQSAKRRRQ